jgi:putative resolvase
METVLNIKKASELLGVTIQTLRNWDNNGKLKPIKTLGGHRRYKLSEIEKVLNNA